MNERERYKKENQDYLAALVGQEGIQTLPGGTLYRVLATGNGDRNPEARSVVTCHYSGSLIDGTVFDSSYERGYPEAFRVCDLIAGFQQALLAMHIGDRWQVYIPEHEGYGRRAEEGIPGYSTLIFEIELLGIA